MLMGAPVATVSVIFAGDRADAGFRHALAHATDRAGLQAVLLPNQAVATGGLVPPGLPGHTPDIARPFDPDQARRLLAQSSQRSPFRLFVATEQRGIHLETLVGGWQDVLRMEVEIIERPIRENMRFSDIADAILWNWIAGWPDPEYYLTVLLHSRSSSNIFRWRHQPFDDLVERASAERNGAARLALFHRADRMVVEELSQVIPVVYGRGVALLQPWVQGWWEWGVPWLSFDDLTVDERSPRYRPRPIRRTG
jgi:ABC-type transport system substrate-binding protein